MKKFIASHPFATFAFLTLVFQFGMVLGIKLMLEEGMAIHDDPQAHMVFRFRVFGPLLFCLLIVFYLEGKAGLRKLFSSFFVWKVPVKWYALGLVWKFILGYTGLLLVGLLFAKWPQWLYVPEFWYGWGANIAFILGVAFVEETAWISFSLAKVQSKFSSLKSVLIVGTCWALWYMPMVAINEGVPKGYPLPVFFASMLSLTVLLAWIYNTTRSGLVLLCAQFVSNTTFFIAPVLPEVATTPELLAQGQYDVDSVTAFVAVFVVVAVLIVLKFGAKNLSTNKRAMWNTPKP